MPFPDFLCRHQTVSKDFVREIELFERNEIFFTSAEKFNDPFDTKPHFHFSRDGGVSLDQAMRIVTNRMPWLDGDAKEAQAEAMRNRLNLPEVQERVKRELADAKRALFYSNSVKCFSPEWNNLLQWAHYADSHKGYCVVFALPRIWPYRLDDGRNKLIAVTQAVYADSYPRIDLDLDLESREEKEAVLTALLTKSKHWSYEEEWRALRVGCSAGLQRLPPDAIRAIVLGCRMSEETRARMIAIVKRHTTPVEIFYAKPAEDRFELDLFEMRGENSSP